MNTNPWRWVLSITPNNWKMISNITISIEFVSMNTIILRIFCLVVDDKISLKTYFFTDIVQQYNLKTFINYFKVYSERHSFCEICIFIIYLTRERTKLFTQ